MCGVFDRRILTRSLRFAGAPGSRSIERMAKPDPRIFRLCLGRLGLPAAAALFVDDRADNVEAAARVGLQTLQFDGADALERLRTLVR